MDDKEEIKAVEKEVKAEVEEAVKFAEESPLQSHTSFMKTFTHKKIIRS